MYGEFNGIITFDLEWPWKVKVPGLPVLDYHGNLYVTEGAYPTPVAVMVK